MQIKYVYDFTLHLKEDFLVHVTTENAPICQKKYMQLTP